eukprot:14314564-Heterocapsa_arctica.AAC.1
MGRLPPAGPARLAGTGVSSGRKPAASRCWPGRPAVLKAAGSAGAGGRTGSGRGRPGCRAGPVRRAAAGLLA